MGSRRSVVAGRVKALACVGVAAAGVALAAVVGSAGAAGPGFADWTAVSNNTATGTLLGNSISLSGSHVWNPPQSVIDGSWPGFSGPDFSPPLATSDEIQISGFQGFSYTLQFGAPVTDPVLELASLASRLDFPAGTQITRLSGDSNFSVSGASVIGALAPPGPDGLSDANGTVQLTGTFQSISFSATPTYNAGSEDGILVQVGAAAPPPPTTTTTTTITTPPTTTTTATIPTTPFPTPTGARVVDIRVSGIEVTQGIQWTGCVGCQGSLPSRTPVKALRGSLPASFATYQGVRMAAGHETVVRVFATLFAKPAGLAALGAGTAKLDLIDSNGTLLETLAPDSGPRALTTTGCWTCVTLAQRADAGASYNFLVPWNETFHRRLSFRATVTPIRYPGAFLPVLQCSGCHANVFTLTGVPFVQTAEVPVHPIPLTVNGVRTRMTENQVFTSAQLALPVNVRIFRYEPDVPISGNSSNEAAAAVLARAGKDGYDGSQYPIGVFVNHVGTDKLGGLTLLNRTLYGSQPPISVVRDNRPLTSAMHEIGHGLGLVHAGLQCGSNSNGQVGEPWPPDDQGRITQITGVGLDRRAWDVFRTGSLPRPLIEGFPAANDLYYDFMSYCGDFTSDATFEADHWISVRNWDRLIDFHPPAQTLPAAADAKARRTRATPLRVLATVDASGAASIFDVSPGQRSLAPPTPGSPYQIELHDDAGNVLSTATPAISMVHVDGAPNGMLLDATLPDVPRAANVTVKLDGAAITHRDRSPHAPTVRLLTPRAGARLGHAQTTLIRWNAKDADGGSLLTTVMYSADGGQTWKVIADQPTGGSVRVPSPMLSATRNGIIKITVSDGFNLTAATVGRLRAIGAPPQVQIIHTGNGTTIRTDQTLLLRGTAFDDADRPLTGNHLHWYANTRLLGHGELLTVHLLPPGATMLKLKATDSHGRSSEASLPIKVLGPTPALTLVRAPANVSAGARRIRITVAANVPAQFTIAGVRHPVNSTPLTITIAIHPGRSRLRLRYSLSSPGGVSKGTYIVSR